MVLFLQAGEFNLSLQNLPPLLTMSQLSSTSSSAVPASFFARIHYEQARSTVEGLRLDKDAEMGFDAAQSWARSFGRAMVRPLFSFFSLLVLTLTLSFVG